MKVSEGINKTDLLCKRIFPSIVRLRIRVIRVWSNQDKAGTKAQSHQDPGEERHKNKGHTGDCEKGSIKGEVKLGAARRLREKNGAPKRH